MQYASRGARRVDQVRTMKNDSADSLLVLLGRSGISFQTVFTHGIRSGTACKYVFIPFPSCAKRLHPAEIRLPLPLLWTQNPPRQAWVGRCVSRIDRRSPRLVPRSVLFKHYIIYIKQKEQKDLSVLFQYPVSKGPGMSLYPDNKQKRESDKLEDPCDPGTVSVFFPDLSFPVAFLPGLSSQFLNNLSHLNFNILLQYCIL